MIGGRGVGKKTGVDGGQAGNKIVPLVWFRLRID